MDNVTSEIIVSSVTPTAINPSEKSLGLSQAAHLWLSGEDGGDARTDRPRRPYAQNEWVYICVNKIIQAARSIQMMLSTTDDKIVESGPAQVAELAISSSYQASLLNEATLANGGKVGNIITVPGKLDDDEIRRLRSQFEARHKGARNAGKTAILTGNADIKTIAQSMA